MQAAGQVLDVPLYHQLSPALPTLQQVPPRLVRPILLQQSAKAKRQTWQPQGSKPRCMEVPKHIEIHRCQYWHSVSKRLLPKIHQIQNGIQVSAAGICQRLDTMNQNFVVRLNGPGSDGQGIWSIASDWKGNKLSRQNFKVHNYHHKTFFDVTRRRHLTSWSCISFSSTIISLPIGSNWTASKHLSSLALS